ncbi:GNAT family N-acetyltransferase [Anaerobacillus isosaccharinicus]|uniref:GNAT family N-acetyltransferase n=1 Tax=Anaerobacillus isosaccharinicus TaxID=1532552 RepID=A0A1S2LJA3_9BACI|nr:GNAT family N-acetyltransferase [Anaerobacillus isosaccharinicus]MBA5586168.1 GNAT family N-acetyltransferase [Anaerobacillus isosaccharinicus]QOY35567.1 GNAT family N-acetyltransferase [Anaerobacillus isosaccharinicus]
MSEKIVNETICLKQYLSEKEYKEINQLEELCSSQDKTNLKLELDFKFSSRSTYDLGLKEINEFLYYIDDVLVAYLGISSFGGSNIGEINGMTHPDFRRKGLFKKLFKLAVEECQKRKFNKVLLLSDGHSNSGINFIKSTNSEYDFSEYRMKLLNKTKLESISPIKLRKATIVDGKEISRQNAIFFNFSEDCEISLEKDEELSEFTYMVELVEMVIGKIRVNFREQSAFISGFGILPEYRGRGYGKAALIEAVRIINAKTIEEIELDVECKNSTALNLYKACGFEEVSVMNYYKFNI